MISVIMANSEQNTTWNVMFLPKIGCKINFGPLLTLTYLPESAAEKKSAAIGVDIFGRRR